MLAGVSWSAIIRRRERSKSLELGSAEKEGTKYGVSRNNGAPRIQNPSMNQFWDCAPLLPPLRYAVGNVRDNKSMCEVLGADIWRICSQVVISSRCIGIGLYCVWPFNQIDCMCPLSNGGRSWRLQG